MAASSTVPARIQALFELERRHDLFAFRVDGWSPWRVMRNAVHRGMMALPMGNTQQANGRRVMQALAATVRLAWTLMTVGRRDLLVKTCRSGLRLQQGSRFRDVYFDGLLAQGWSHFKLEEINSPHFDRQAAAAMHPAHLDPVVFTFWGRVLGHLFPVREAREFCEFTSRLLQAEVAYTVRPNWLMMRVSTVYWQARIYHVLLSRLRPHSVLVSDTGDYALRIASERVGARFIELQHGVFDEQHPDAVPGWVEGETHALVLPDVLACRGSYWIERLAATRQGQHLAIAVGNELIDMARAKRSQRNASDATYRLLLTTQGLDSEALAVWIQRLLACAPSNTGFELTIKLHPVYDMHTRAYDALAHDPRVRVIPGAEPPNVFDLLAAADLHLSISSACHFDAASIGLTTMVVPLTGHEAMFSVVDDVQVFVANEPVEVWHRLAQRRGDLPQGERFATPGFINNFRKLLCLHLKKGTA